MLASSENYAPDASCFNQHQHRRSWKNLASISERYQISDRAAAAAIANCALKDAGLITDLDLSYAFDRGKLK